jgi:hypothetical protein
VRFFEDVTARGSIARAGPVPNPSGEVGSTVKADGSEGQSCGGVVRVRRRYSNAYCPSGLLPEPCVEPAQRTRFENIAERKLRRRQLTEDGNVEISGRDLHEGQELSFTKFPPDRRS